MSNVHFMIDLETLATSNDAVVLSIGAVCFDPYNGKVIDDFYHELRLDQQPSRKIDSKTLQWWAKQIAEDASKATLFMGEDKVPVRNALILLKNFFDDNSDYSKRIVWACDPDFDCAILKSLFNDYDLFLPWQYYQPKSVRTVRFLLKELGFEESPVKTHNALEDCKRQIAEVHRFYQHMNLKGGAE